jgi:hypothetical protein
MSRFRFQSAVGTDVSPPEWLSEWAVRYPSNNYAGHTELIAKHEAFTAEDFIRIGKWKDAVKTEAKWKANIASVAYPIWMQAASELPKCPEDGEVENFLADWSERKYTDEFASGPREKRFGLSRATTLLHFVSGEGFPIFDAHVRRAMSRLLGEPVLNTVRWYLDSYLPLFLEVAALCGSKNDVRTVDKALFSYGKR